MLKFHFGPVERGNNIREVVENQRELTSNHFCLNVDFLWFTVEWVWKSQDVTENRIGDLWVSDEIAEVHIEIDQSNPDPNFIYFSDFFKETRNFWKSLIDQWD